MKPEELTLEPARPGDFAPVNALARQVHDLHAAWRPDIYRGTEFPIRQEDFRELVDRDCLYVLRSQGKILAYAVIALQHLEGSGLVTRNILRLEQLCVDGECRRQGIGRHFLEQLARLGRERGCTDLQLVCDPRNRTARAFYEDFGMEVKAIQYRVKL